MAKVVILGAGLTGLSAAYHFEKKGFKDYKIFEKEENPGGLCKSIKQDKFTFDYTGHLIHINNPYFKIFLDDITTKNQTSFEETFEKKQRRSFVFSNNLFTEYPFQINLFGLPSNVITECIEGFINRNKSIKKPQNFQQWTLKYFGKGIGKNFLFPYNEKLWATNLKKLMYSWTGRFVPQITLKDILNGSFSKNNESQFGYNNVFYYPKSEGIQQLINLTSNLISNGINTNFNATEIDLKNKIIKFENGHIESFEILINTIPLNHCLKILKEKSNCFTKKARKDLTSTSVINFNLGFDKSNISDKHWLYIPEKVYPFYRIGFWNNISATSTPSGTSAIYGETSFIYNTKNNTQIKNLTNKSIQKSLDLLKLKNQNIVTKKILLIDNAYVIYDKWREKNLKKLLSNLESQNLFSIGRYGAWKYSSMEESILDGKNIAKEILNTSKFLFKGALKIEVEPKSSVKNKRVVKNEQFLQK